MRALRSIVLLAFLVTAWIIASLALSGDAIQNTAPLGIGSILSTLLATAEDLFLTVLIFAMSLVFYWLVRDRKLLAEAVKNLLSQRKKRESDKGNRNLKRDVIGFVIFIAIVIAVRFTRLLPSPQPPKGNGSSLGSSFFIIPGFDGEAFQSSLLGVYHFLATWAFELVFIAIAGLCLLIFLRGLAQLRIQETSAPFIDESIVQDTIGAIQNGYRSLKESDDYRSGILICYRRLCDVFEPQSRISQKLLTARELRARMLEQFGGADRPISLLTSLFEEARYSSHQISSEMKGRAIKSLEEIEEYLRHPPETTFKAVQ